RAARERSPAPDALVERVHVARDARAEVGVDERRRRPLVFAEARDELAPHREGDAGQLFADDLGRALLVRRVLERPQEADRDRLDSGRANRRAGVAHIVLAQPADLDAGLVNSLADAAPQPA